MPIELRSQFDSYCQKDTREKFMVQMEDMTELQAPSLDARMDQQEIKEELEGEPSDSSDRLDYRGPEMSVMFRSRTHSGSLEDLTSFPHPTSRNDMSHSQTSGVKIDNQTIGLDVSIGKATRISCLTGINCTYIYHSCTNCMYDHFCLVFVKVDIL